MHPVFPGDPSRLDHEGLHEGLVEGHLELRRGLLELEGHAEAAAVDDLLQALADLGLERGEGVGQAHDHVEEAMVHRPDLDAQFVRAVVGAPVPDSRHAPHGHLVEGSAIDQPQDGAARPGRQAGKSPARPRASGLPANGGV